MCVCADYVVRCEPKPQVKSGWNTTTLHPKSHLASAYVGRRCVACPRLHAWIARQRRVKGAFVAHLLKSSVRNTHCACRSARGGDSFMASASFEARQDRRSLRSASDALPVCMQSVCASCGAGRASHLLCALPMTSDGYASTAKRHAHGGAKRGPTVASQLGSATFGIVQRTKPRRRCHVESSEFAQVNAAVMTTCADAGVCVCVYVSQSQNDGAAAALEPSSQHGAYICSQGTLCKLLTRGAGGDGCAALGRSVPSSSASDSKGQVFVSRGAAHAHTTRAVRAKLYCLLSF